MLIASSLQVIFRVSATVVGACLGHALMFNPATGMQHFKGQHGRDALGSVRQVECCMMILEAAPRVYWQQCVTHTSSCLHALSASLLAHPHAVSLPSSHLFLDNRTHVHQHSCCCPDVLPPPAAYNPWILGAANIFFCLLLTPASLGQFRLVVVLGLLTFASVTLCQYAGCCGAVGSLTYLVGRILATGGLYCAARGVSQQSACSTPDLVGRLGVAMQHCSVVGPALQLPGLDLELLSRTRLAPTQLRIWCLHLQSFQGPVLMALK